MSKTISDIATVIDSLHKTPEYKRTGIPMVRVVDINNSFLKLENCLLVDRKTCEEHNKNHVPKIGDTIITRVGSYGMLAYVDTDKQFCLGQNIAIISPKDNKEFIYYYLQSPYIQNIIYGNSGGSSYKCIGLERIKKLPYIDEGLNTKKIGKLLYTIDKKIENNNKINAELESMAKTIYDYWFLQFEFPNEDGNPYKSSGGKMVWNEELKREIPEGWEVDILKNCVSKEKNAIVDGPFGTQLKIGEYVDFGVPIYEMEQLNGKFIVDKPKHFITDKKYLDVKRSSVKNGDIIISKTGTLGLLGIVRSNYDKGIIVSRLAKITPDETKIGKYTLLIFLGKLTDSEYWLKQSNGSTMPILNNGLIENTKIILPNNQLYLKFEKIITPFYEKIYNIQQENQELSSLRDFLLPLLMNGQVGFKEEALADAE